MVEPRWGVKMRSGTLKFIYIAPSNLPTSYPHLSASLPPEAGVI
jgi:hypothetical protein